MCDEEEGKVGDGDEVMARRRRATSCSAAAAASSITIPVPNTPILSFAAIDDLYVTSSSRRCCAT